MTEKTEEQIAKEKAAVASMKGAQASMTAALARISDLERSLEGAVKALRDAKGYVSERVYLYGSDRNGQQITVHKWLETAASEAGRFL